MDELKPCPFCKGEKISICTEEELGFSVDIEPGYFAVCNVQYGGCGASSGWQKTPEDAEDAWNRRVDNA